MIAPVLCAPLLLAAASPDVHPDVPRRLEEVGAAKVWIFFEDKGLAGAAEREAALDELLASFPERALARRLARRTAPGLVDERDLPLASAHLAALEELGIEVVTESRWLNGVSATVDAGQLARLEELPAVRRVQLVGRSVLAATTPLGGCFGTEGGFYGYARSQIELNAIDKLHASGFTGAGVVVGVLDTGFVTTHEAFQQPGHVLDVVASWDFVDGDSDVGIDPGDDPFQHHHGTTILGTLGAYLPDTMVGGAYDASFVLCKTEDVTQEVQAEEDFYVAGLEFAELNGADVATSSLGYIDWYTQADLDGRTAVTTQAVNVATANGVHCLTAAGNNGHDSDPGTSTLIAPADAFEVITCGAAEVTGEAVWFSSDGPSADGRVKPEVLAMGDGVASVWPDDDFSYGCSSGTSLATPLVAGAVACLVQAHPDWGVSTMRQQLVDSGSYFGDPLPDPAFVYGYGLFDALDAHLAPVPFLAAPLVPGAPGTVNRATIIGGTPGSFVFTVWGFGLASFSVPGCPLLSLDVVPTLILPVAADAGGEASLSGFIGPGIAGGTLHLQAIELDTCRGTAVLSTTF